MRRSYFPTASCTKAAVAAIRSGVIYDLIASLLMLLNPLNVTVQSGVKEQKAVVKMPPMINKANPLVRNNPTFANTFKANCKKNLRKMYV